MSYKGVVGKTSFPLYLFLYFALKMENDLCYHFHIVLFSNTKKPLILKITCFCSKQLYLVLCANWQNVEPLILKNQIAHSTAKIVIALNEQVYTMKKKTIIKTQNLQR